MNETIKNLKERRSIRSFSSKELRKDILEEIIEAASYAPSGMGAQSAKMVVVTNKEIIKKLSTLNAKVMGTVDKDPFYGAPTVVVVFADSSRKTFVEDGSLVMGNLMNAAHALDVDSCWIHRAREVFESEAGKELMALWGIDENYVGIGHCVLGYREGDYPTAKPRKEDYAIYIS